MEKTEQEAILKKYLVSTPAVDEAEACISSAQDCHEFMLNLEKALDSEEFQSKLAALWDRVGLSYPMRLEVVKDLVATCLSATLVAKGFAPGRSGLSAAVKQMQKFWSTDRQCAQKALDLEELAEVSLADLE
eukprot:TRINITY_DN47096_c0_g1_i1.p3 TRINITY_DN47096_c0_g1~~TRINITY_DN47096_c0_g1_i1.p3  ORF type:complete len:132 (-),score=45.08 TRINITY_DN47096_c0_g1_i1:683-1078(-)